MNQSEIEEVVKTTINKLNVNKLSESAKNLEEILNKKQSFLGQLKSIIINYWLVVILILLFGIAVFLNVSRTIIDNQNLVLGFIGALATIIVVSNYMQVKDVENKFNEKLKEFEERKDIEIQKAFDDASKDIEIKKQEVRGTAHYYLGIALFDSKIQNYHIHSLDNFIKAIDDISTSNSEYARKLIGYSIDKILSLISNGELGWINCSEEIRKAYINMVDKADDDRKFEIIDFIRKIPSNE